MTFLDLNVKAEKKIATSTFLVEVFYVSFHVQGHFPRGMFSTVQTSARVSVLRVEIENEISQGFF